MEMNEKRKKYKNTKVFVTRLKKKLDKDMLRLIDIYLDAIYEKFRDYPNELLDILSLYINITIKNS